MRGIDHHRRRTQRPDGIAHALRDRPRPPGPPCSTPPRRPPAAATAATHHPASPPVSSRPPRTAPSPAAPPARSPGPSGCARYPPGSATPLVSITMNSGRGSRRSSAASVRSRSPSSEQQMQPLAQADHAVAGARDQLRIDVDGAEIVDHGGDPPSLRMRQHVVHDRGLARARGSRSPAGSGPARSLSPLERRAGAPAGPAAPPHPARRR